MATGKKKRAAPEAAQKIHTPVMYVGPTIHKIGVINNVIYTEIPETVKKAITEKPIIKVLLVPVIKYPEAEKSIREESGYFWSAYKAALEYLEELKRR